VDGGGGAIPNIILDALLFSTIAISERDDKLLDRYTYWVRYFDWFQSIGREVHGVERICNLTVRSLLSSYSEDSSSMPIGYLDSFATINNSFSIVQSLVRYGKLCEACQLSIRLLQSFEEIGNLQISYNILDEVVESCESKLKNINFVENRPYLVRCLNCLKHRLQIHFELQVVISL
jgi:hypothetical protein